MYQHYVQQAANAFTKIAEALAMIAIEQKRANDLQQQMKDEADRAERSRRALNRALGPF